MRSIKIYNTPNLYDLFKIKKKIKI